MSFQLQRLVRSGVSFVVMALLVLAASAVVAFAQTETGQVLIRVSDPNGAIVPGAAITLTSTERGDVKTATASDNGEAVITNLQPGLYKVSVKAQNFAEFTQDVQVTVGSKLTVDAKLGVQGQQAQVTVVGGSGVEVNTQTQELSNVVSGTQIRELPTITRNPYALATIAGNVSDVNGNDAQGGATSRGVGVAVNGQRAASTNILLDGGENVDTFTATAGQSVPLDSVGEFRIISSNFSAEYGRATGGIVNVATRAGTNDFHGTGYWFNRISRFASNGFFNNANELAKSHFARNQFGYSIGGPVIKNKLFFFSSTEWTRVRSVSNEVNVVPTAQLIAASNANTQAFFTGQSLASGVQPGETFTVTQVAASLRATPSSTSSNAFLRLNPALPAFQVVRYSVPANVGAGDPQNSYDTVARLDYNLSDHTQIFGRFALESLNFFEGVVSNSPWSGYNTGETDFNQNWLVNVTHNFSSTLVSQTKLVYNRLNDRQPLGAAQVGPTLYMSGSSFSQLVGHTVAFPGYLPFTPGNGIPFGGPQNLGQGYEDISWTHNNHTVRIGGQYVYIQDNRLFGAYETATEQLGGSSLTALNNLVNGVMQTFQAAIYPQGKFPGQTLTLPVGPPVFTRSNRYNDWATYFNDAWRFTPRLTFNLGMRYEFYGVQRNKNQQLDSNFYFGGNGTLSQANVRTGSVQIAPNSPVGGLWKPDRNNFAPRLGFAWDIFGDGKTSVRGGYGRSFERNFGNVTFNVIQNPPNYAVVAITPADVGGPISITRNNAGPLSGSTGTKTLPGTSLRAVDPNIVNAYADDWNLALEHELMPGTVFSIAYSGSAGHKLYDISNINRVGTGLFYLGTPATNPFTGATSSRLNGQYTNINFRSGRGHSMYNGLTLSLESSQLRRSLFKGMQFTARYTWSHAQDNLSTTFSETNNNFNLGYLDPWNPDLDYGDADFDVRHRFTSSWNWDLPVGKNMTGAAREILGGWSLTGIFVARTGTPFTVYDCTNLISTTCMRLLQVSPDLSFHQTTLTDSSQLPYGGPGQFNYIDLRSQIPGAGSFADFGGGNELGPFPANMTRRNAFRGPGFWNLDFGLYKNVRITEGTRLQLRSEFFNIFNHANLFVLGSNADIAEVDQVQAFRSGRRHIQFAVKLIF